jgi:hypothetical protein
LGDTKLLALDLETDEAGPSSRGADMAEQAFRILTIRTVGTTAQPALYPLLSTDGGEVIAHEELDDEGLSQPYCRASGVTVSRIIDGAERPILRLNHLNIKVYVTAGRLALACKRYRTANAWALAGPGMGFAGRGVTSARVSRHLQGGVMVGHIRYPWIRSVSARPRTPWWYGRDTLVIEYAMGPRTPMLLRLDLRRSKHTPGAMAAEICWRVVKYWQTYDRDGSRELQAALRDLARRAHADMMRRDRGKSEVYKLPAWHPVDPNVPFLRRPRRSRPPYDGDEAGEE